MEDVQSFLSLHPVLDLLQSGKISHSLPAISGWTSENGFVMSLCTTVQILATQILSVITPSFYDYVTQSAT